MKMDKEDRNDEEFYLLNAFSGIEKEIIKKIEESLNLIEDPLHLLDLIDSCKQDLAWFRDVRLKTHFRICRKVGLKSNHSAVKLAEMLQEQLSDIELKSFIQVVRIIRPDYGLSEAYLNKRRSEIDFYIDKMIAELI